MDLCGIEKEAELEIQYFETEMSSMNGLVFSEG